MAPKVEREKLDLKALDWGHQGFVGSLVVLFPPRSEGGREVPRGMGAEAWLYLGETC